MKTAHRTVAGAWIPLLLLAAALDAGFPGTVSHVIVPLAAAGGVSWLAAVQSADRRHLLRSAGLAALPLLALLAVYALNPTHRAEPDGALLPLPHWSGAPGAVFQSGALVAASRIVAVLSVFAMSAAMGRRAGRIATNAVALGAGLVAVVAIQQRLLPRPFPIFEYTGVFVSPNHFAAFANLALPLALSAAWRARYDALRRGRPSSPAPLFFLAALLLAFAIALSRSRAGLALLLFSAAVSWAILFRLERRYGHWHPPSVAVRLALPLAVLLAATAGLALAGARGWPAASEWQFRTAIIRDALRMWKDRPLWGVGPGGFALAFPYYQSDTDAAVRVLHAHCEPIQFLAEFGALGALIALGAVAVMAHRLSRGMNRDDSEAPRLAELERPFAGLALTTVGLHALVDFPFRAPAIALLAAFCAGQWVAGGERRRGARSDLFAYRRAAAPPPAGPPVSPSRSQRADDGPWDLVIRPRAGWLDLQLGDLWRYRDLVGLFVRRDFVALYKQTILGPAWFVVQPLLTTFVFVVVFGNIARLSTDGLPRTLFYLSGNIVWMYFAGVLTEAANTFIGHAHLFGKVYFPRLTVPLAIALSNLMKFGLQLVLFFGVWLLFAARGAAIRLTPDAALFPLLLLIMAALALGLGILFSSLTTKYRDLRFLLDFGVRLLMYATPVIFPLSSITGGRWRWVLLLNPMTPVIEAFRRGFLGEGVLHWGWLGYSAVCAFAALACGAIIFHRVERTFMDTV